MHLTWLAISWEEKCVSKLVGKLLQWGWCKMNTDGSRCIVTGRVSCGGVLKNAKGILPGKMSVGAHSNLIYHINELRYRNWKVTYNHIFREVNDVADELAKMDTSGHVGGNIHRLA
ncbi:hypothetical protein V6N11_019046 [Hibiscus sabdariffa]|uniref:RNase H type-1 domain-containing protein n=1 Tax=Hibiscus sabdariffa TaxID=183260 RepID=A0ABR2R1Z0_9ROSI